MAIAVLLEVPDSQEHWQNWAFVNMSHHRDIIRKISELGGPRLTESILDPFDYENPAPTWLYKHALMHSAMDQVLGIQGFDLSGVDWQDHEQLQGWIDAHANEHVQAGAILGLG